MRSKTIVAIILILLVLLLAKNHFGNSDEQENIAEKGDDFTTNEDEFRIEIELQDENLGPLSALYNPRKDTNRVRVAYNISKDEHLKTLIVTSPDFKQGDWLPIQYTCEGESLHPGFDVENLPKRTKSLVLIMDDMNSEERRNIDETRGEYNHWIVWNIDSNELIRENKLPDGVTRGTNYFGKTRYKSACPTDGTHEYRFTIIALPAKLTDNPLATKDDIMSAIKGSVLAWGDITAIYSLE